jgi:hypothetical protein
MPYKNYTDKQKNRREYRASKKGRAKILAWGRSQKGRECYRDYNLRRRYGVSFQQFKTLYAAQNGLCAICRVYMTTGTTQAHLDHSHATGAVRQLLCRCCNGGLGLFKDNQEIMLNAIDYLKKHESLLPHTLSQ